VSKRPNPFLRRRKRGERSPSPFRERRSARRGMLWDLEQRRSWGSQQAREWARAMFREAIKDTSFEGLHDTPAWGKAELERIDTGIFAALCAA
jgi:hypothetical protein